MRVTKGKKIGRTVRADKTKEGKGKASINEGKKKRTMDGSRHAVRRRE